MVTVLNAVKSVFKQILLHSVKFLPLKHASLLRIIVLMICGVFSIFSGTGRGTAAQTGDIK